MSLKKVVTAILLAFVGVMFIMYVTPTIEGAISTANITSPLTSGLVTMASWLLPVGGIIGVFYGIFRLFGGGGKGA